MSQIDYVALGQTDEEIALLREHDQDEDLHPYVQSGPEGSGDGWWACVGCGDDPSGLMHNNTWRNVEPLMEESPAAP